MQVQINCEGVKDLLDAYQLVHLPCYVELNWPEAIYKAEQAKEVIEAVVDEYSGSGSLLIPLDTEATAYIKKCEDNWQV